MTSYNDALMKIATAQAIKEGLANFLDRMLAESVLSPDKTAVTLCKSMIDDAIDDLFHEEVIKAREVVELKHRQDYLNMVQELRTV